MAQKNHLYLLWTNDNKFTPEIEALGVEVKYWGSPLTDILKQEETLLTI